jgi:opacity protein-like surface antigen
MAQAADLLPPPPPMPYAAAAVEVGGGWYLRGDIGMTNQEMDRLSDGVTDAQFETVHFEFDSSPLFGVGLGYQFNPWLRVDVTGEYRGKSTLHGLERQRGASPDFVDQYSATKSEWTGLANVYVDLGTWYGVTPFVGAGVGVTRNTISAFTDVDVGVGGLAFSGEHSETDLAWALHAGLAYTVIPNFKVELAYRYLNLGDAKTATMTPYDNSGCCARTYTLKGIDSHDVKVGMRWMLGGPVMAAAGAPIIRKY